MTHATTLVARSGSRPLRNFFGLLLRPLSNGSRPLSETYHYRAFGLNVASCLACPELLAGDAPAEVTVRYGEARQPVDPIETETQYAARPGHLWLHVLNVAKFDVRGGNEITIERLGNVTDDELRLFLLGSAFAALLKQRG